MVSYKAEVTLNEKDSLLDLLTIEKALVKCYATALTEGVSKGFRQMVKAHFNEVANDQIATFFMITKQGYDRVESASEESKCALKEKYQKEKTNLY
ncbi:MAG: spore coat protein [Clostridia bacterium]|nr:spore coat protein [Clostridia bacterium]